MCKDRDSKKFSKWIFIGGAILLVVVVPVIVHIAFAYPAISSFWAAKWTAGEFLGYLGTTMLSALALWQNRQLKIEADKQAKLAKKQELDMKKPRFFVVSKSSSGSPWYEMTIKIQNISFNFAEDCRIEDIALGSGDNFHHITCKQPIIGAIGPTKEECFTLENSSPTWDIISFSLYCKGPAGVKVCYRYKEIGSATDKKHFFCVVEEYEDADFENTKK